MNNSIKIAKSKIAVRAACVAFALVLVIGAVPFGVAASEINLHYGSSGAYNEMYNPSEVLGKIVGDYSVSEGAYLDELGEYTMTFSPRIADSYVSLSAYGDKMTVNASVYSYTADNGTTVTWTPTTAFYNGQAYEMTKTGTAYVATIDGIDTTASQSVQVNYSASFSLTAAVVKEISNRAYTDAYSARTELQKYKSDLAAYTTNLKKYNDYLNANTEYTAALAKYNKYLEDLDAYNAALKKYQDYLTALDEYNTNLDKYNKYVADLDAYNKAKSEYDIAKAKYDEDKIKYTETYAAYLKYVAELKQAMEHLKYLELCYVTSDEGHNLLSTLQGGAVASVIARKDELVLVGVSATDLNNCADATEALSGLLVEYGALKTDTEKFNWYKSNYGNLRTQISKLYSGLNSVYGNSTVRSQSAKQERAYRFCQLLSQLYYLNTYLDDNVVADPNASITTYIDGTRTTVTYKLSDVLESAYAIADDNDSSVADISLPKEVEKPTVPTFSLKEPTKPNQVYEPAAPKAVTEPTAPETVKKPTAPQTIADPGKEPEEPEYSELILALVDEIDSGDLKSRSVTSGIVLTETSSITKVLSAGDIHEYPIVTFLNKDGTLIDTVVVKNGVLEKQVTANIPSDEKTAYFFDKWVNAAGQPVDFSTLKENITVYPTFKAVSQKYKITFITAKGQSTIEASYGKMPTCPISTAKASDDTYDYTFTGWTPALKAVEGDATYEAVYEKSYRQYNVTWNINGTEVTSTHKLGDIPSCPIDPDTLLGVTESGIMTFIGWDKEISAVSGDTVYTALIDKQWLITVVDGDGNDGVEIAPNADNYVLKVPMTVRSFDLENIIPTVISQGKPMLIECANGASIEIPLDVLKNIMTEDDGAIYGAPTDGKAVITLAYNTADAEKSLSIKLGGASCPAGITLTFDCSDAASAIIAGYSATADAELAEAKIYKQGNNIIMYTDGTATTYAVTYSYSVNVMQTEGGSISADCDTARSGKRVNITIVPDAGKNIDYIIVNRTQSGTADNISVSRTDRAKREITVFFDMPSEPITVSAVYTDIYYTVSFYIDGELYSTAKYKAGESITVPQTPVKPNTETEAFTFSGWSPAVIEIASADAEYYAEFTSSPLTDDDYGDDGHGAEGVLVVIGEILLLCAIAAGTVYIVIRLKKKKSSKPKFDI